MNRENALIHPSPRRRVAAPPCPPGAHRAANLLLVFFLAYIAAFAQPSQGPPVPSSMRNPGGKTFLPPALEGVGIDQKLNAQIPLELAFHDEYGRQVRLSSFFGERPVLLALVYYQCPMLCTQVLNGVEMSLKAISFNPGRDFEVVVVSFDPNDTPELAAAKKRNYLRRYGRPDTANGWHFLTGEPANIKALTDAAGFRYRWDAASRQFAHASGIFLLTPEGRISRYFYGVEYPPRDLRLGLVEASRRKIGNAVDALLLFCYHYDPATGKYGALVMNILRLGAGAFLALGAVAFYFLWRRTRHAGSLAG